jgi:hypothetical protein
MVQISYDEGYAVSPPAQWYDYDYPPSQPATPDLPSIEPPPSSSYDYGGEPFYDSDYYFYDSDYYYSISEPPAWWYDYGYSPSERVTPDPSSINPPYGPERVDFWYNFGRDVDYYSNRNNDYYSAPPPSTQPPTGGQTGSQPSERNPPTGQEPSTSPLPVPETNDPLYRAIGSLLFFRPAPAQATPVVVQGRPTNPWPIVLVGLAAVGTVAYFATRRKKT